VKAGLTGLLLGVFFLFSCTGTTRYVPEKYRELTIVDIHNHDARIWKRSLGTWNRYGIDRIVLFGDISEPSAVKTDDMALKAAKIHPDRFYPFFAGFDINDPGCRGVVRANLEMGYAGVGEFVAASTWSPVTSNLPWKGLDPLDGYFSDVYDICAEYRVPILLHIDPPEGLVIDKFSEAMNLHPNTIFIFAHANAYNTPDRIVALLEIHENLYIDFFPGFTAYNSDSRYDLADFVPLIEKWPDRFMVSSDSGYGIGYNAAYKAIYELFDLLRPETVELVAHGNWERIESLRRPVP
jgi:predicted TIM-barrel fold metal-dependent hydrolase